MLPLLTSVLLASADGGAVPRFEDVRVGDALTYELDGIAALTLRACATSARSVTVAVSMERDGGAPPGTWLLDRFVVDLPVAPLDQPALFLGLRDRPQVVTAAGRRFGECAPFHVIHPTAHGPSGPVVRCAARELGLGGGLVSQAFRWLNLGSGLRQSMVKLVRVSSQDTRACPGRWPRVTTDGVWRWQSSTGVSRRRLAPEEGCSGRALATCSSWTSW